MHGCIDVWPCCKVIILLPHSGKGTDQNMGVPEADEQCRSKCRMKHRAPSSERVCHAEIAEQSKQAEAWRKEHDQQVDTSDKK